MATDNTRKVFMGLLLQKLGLQVNEEEQVIPFLSRLHLTSHHPTAVSDLVASWAEVITVVDGDEYIKGENDVFRIDKPGSAWSVKELKRAVSAVSVKLPSLASMTGNGDSEGTSKNPKTNEEEIEECIKYTAASSSDQISDHEKIVKVIVPHTQELPSIKETLFHHEAFYANLVWYHDKQPPGEKPSASTEPPHWLHDDSCHANRWPRKRWQRVGVSIRRIDVLHGDAPFVCRVTGSARRVHTVPRCPCNRARHQGLRARLRQDTSEAEVAKRHLCAASRLVKQPSSENRRYPS
jgi:hypothetical protein